MRLYVPGFQKLIFKHVIKCKWIPPKKFNGFRVQMSVQQANISSCFEFRKCKRSPQTVGGFITVIAKLKSRAGIIIFSNAEFKSKNLTIVSGIHEQILKHWFTISNTDLVDSYSSEIKASN